MLSIQIYQHQSNETSGNVKKFPCNIKSNSILAAFVKKMTHEVTNVADFEPQNISNMPT